jgi:chromate reductase
MTESPILLISGTNRSGSNSMKIAKIIEGHYRKASVPVSLLGMDELPGEVFRPDAYMNKPPAMVELQRRVLDSHGLHVVTAEYNGSFPGVLKYFIDMLKFPESFDRKPVAFVGVANGMWGGLRAVEQLQMVFGYRNAHIYPDRVFIPMAKNVLSADGQLTDPALNERLAKQVIGFAKFAGMFRAA